MGYLVNLLKYNLIFGNVVITVYLQIFDHVWLKNE